ncbi:hypothetical protein [Mucilaginibacter terrae]|uniref:hypothetical protein n=1 Tax=Mucilaginibacter terrae TaxID=1955052 RepID=UPI00366D218E
MAGFGIGGGNIGVHGYFNGTLLRNGYELTGKFSAQDHIIDFTTDAIDLNSQEYALLIGKKLTRHPFSYFLVSAGLSAIRFEHRNEGIPTPSNKPFHFFNYDYTYENRSTAGIPIEIKYFNNSLSRFVPVTAVFAVNLNSIRTIYSISLGLQFGSTRERRIKKTNN